MATCLNCGRLVDQSFCPACGQKTSVKRLDLLTLVQDLPSILFNFDRGFLYNLVQLTVRPGYAIKDYLDGKRKPFQNPLAYALVILAAMLIALNLFPVHYYDPVQDAWMTPEQASRWRDYDAANQAWAHYYKFFLPFALPWVALVYCLWLRVMKSKYTYAESLCIALFNAGQMTAPQILVLATAYWVDRTWFTRLGDFLINLPVVVLLGLFQFYQLGNPGLRKVVRVALAIIGGLLLGAMAQTMFFAFLPVARSVGL